MFLWATGCEVASSVGCPYIARYKVAVQNILYSRMHQCFNLNGKQTDIDRYWRKKLLTFCKKCLKMYSFFAFAFKVCSTIITSKKFSWKVSRWVSENAKKLFFQGFLLKTFFGEVKAGINVLKSASNSAFLKPIFFLGNSKSFNANAKKTVQFRTFCKK